MVSREGNPLKLPIWISSQGGREWLALTAVTELTTHTHAHSHTMTHSRQEREVVYS